MFPTCASAWLTTAARRKVANLTATLTESKSFELGGDYLSVNEMGAAISRGDLDAGVVIPYDFERNLERGRPTKIQVLLNATNANTAAIGQGYAEGIIQMYNRNVLSSSGIHAQFTKIGTHDLDRRGTVQLTSAFLFNPGLVNAWYIVTGVFGLLLILNASLISASAMVKERERGTVEQLLMTPASTAEIIIAKISPLFLLLNGMIVLALFMMHFVFHTPFRGNLLLVYAGGGVVRALRNRHRYFYRHLHQDGPAIHAHQLFRQSAACLAVRRADAY